ncbi:MAG: hypothetical protein KAW09_09820 [Thermoplasmata archaeon]|nr:hypothetical protein [Thermoplasmata archaeon]
MGPHRRFDEGLGGSATEEPEAVEAELVTSEERGRKGRHRWLALTVILVVVIIIVPNVLFLPLLEVEETDYVIIHRSCVVDGDCTTCSVSLFGGIDGFYYVTIRLYDDFDVRINGSGKHLGSEKIWSFYVEFADMASEEYSLAVDAPTRTVSKSVYEVLIQG